VWDQEVLEHVGTCKLRDVSYEYVFGNVMEHPWNALRNRFTYFIIEINVKDNRSCAQLRNLGICCLSKKLEGYYVSRFVIRSQANCTLVVLAHNGFSVHFCNVAILNSTAIPNTSI
jgi:hypothetical protein